MTARAALAAEIDEAGVSAPTFFTIPGQAGAATTSAARQPDGTSWLTWALVLPVMAAVGYWMLAPSPGAKARTADPEVPASVHRTNPEPAADTTVAPAAQPVPVVAEKAAPPARAASQVAAAPKAKTQRPAAPKADAGADAADNAGGGDSAADLEALRRLRRNM